MSNTYQAGQEILPGFFNLGTSGSLMVSNFVLGQKFTSAGSVKGLLRKETLKQIKAASSRGLFDMAGKRADKKQAASMLNDISMRLPTSQEILEILGDREGYKKLLDSIKLDGNRRVDPAYKENCITESQDTRSYFAATAEQIDSVDKDPLMMRINDPLAAFVVCGDDLSTPSVVNSVAIEAVADMSDAAIVRSIRVDAVETPKYIACVVEGYHHS